MPFDEVMHKFKHGELHSGSKKGPKVKSRKQALAIMLSEKKKAQAGDTEYQPLTKTKKPKSGINVEPSPNFMSRFGKK
jgi:hypothetical protein